MQSSPFGPVQVTYDEHVLAPRRWTLVQSARAARRLCGGPPGPILELHCGAGQIGQAAAAWTDRPLVQVDDDPACCAWAAHNAVVNEVRAAVVRADVDAAPVRDGECSIVLADPPYVPTGEMVGFPDDPGHAIDGGVDGLDGFRACLPAAARLVRPGGAVLLQVRGPAQAARVIAHVRTNHDELRPAEVVTVSATRAVVELERR